MKILHTVEFYYPSIGGSQEVVRQLSERMAAAGHDVTVATSYLPERNSFSHNGVKIRQFRISGNQVRGFVGDTQEYVDFLFESKFDVIMNYAAQQWTADLTFPVLDKLKCVKIFVPCGFSALHNPEYEEYFHAMPEILRRYDHTVYLASKYRDIDFAKNHGVTNLQVIPNGADEREFLMKGNENIRKMLGIWMDTRLILHVGTFTGQKGQKEAMQIFQRSSLSHAALLLIGNPLDRKLYRRMRLSAVLYNNMPTNRRAKRKIFVKELSRKQTVAAFQQADLFLFPSNIEASPLVLFESCAAKTPFLTTDVGNAREIIDWTHGGRLLPTDKDRVGLSRARIEESAAILAKTLSDEKQLHQLAEDGYSAWNNKYRWDKIAQQYLKLYGAKR